MKFLLYTEINAMLRLDIFNDILLKYYQTSLFCTNDKRSYVHTK